MAILGRRIITARKQRGWTQGQLATYAKVAQSYISKLENDHVASLGSDPLRRIADALNVSTDYLLGLSNDPSPSDAHDDLSDIEWRIVRLFRLLPVGLQQLALEQLDLWLDHRDQWLVSDTGQGNGERTDRADQETD